VEVIALPPSLRPLTVDDGPEDIVVLTQEY